VEAQASDDGSGVASFTVRIGTQSLTATLTPSLPPPAASVTATGTWDTIAFADGTHTLTAEAEDAAGNPGSATRVLIVDNTPPETAITGGPSGEVATTSVTFTFEGSDNLTAAPSLQFAWRLDGGAWSAFGGATTAQLGGLSEAEHTFEVKARDLAGNEDPSPAARTFTVRLGPSITGVDPTSGPIGTFVTISGTNFQPGTTTVTFNGLAAVVRTLTATQITTTVPIGASTGPLTVSTPLGVASVTFTVTLTGDFTLAASPATVRASPAIRPPSASPPPAPAPSPASPACPCSRRRAGSRRPSTQRSWRPQRPGGHLHLRSPGSPDHRRLRRRQQHL
jgi:hypothetical protein